MSTYKVCSMSEIQLAPISGRGRGLSEFVEGCLSMSVGQGIKITQSHYNNGKGVTGVYAAGHRRGIKFMVRRDTKGGIWLFRAHKQAA